MENPEDNQSLMDQMAGSSYIQSPLADEEEAMAALETDAEGQEVLKEGMDSAIEYLSDESGLSVKYPKSTEPLASDNSSADIVMPGDGTETVAVGGENVNTDPIREARKRFTGVDAGT